MCTQILSAMVVDLLRMMDGLGRLSGPPPEGSRFYDPNFGAMEWFDAREDYSPRQQRQICEKLWDWYNGDQTKRPNRNVMMTGWLTAIDNAFVEAFIHDPTRERSASPEIELLVGQFAEVGRDDRYNFFHQRDEYVAEVVKITNRMAKAAAQDTSLSEEEKALWEQMPLKISVLVAFAEPGHPRRPWFPILTRSVYKFIIRRLHSVEEALKEVSTSLPILLFLLCNVR